MIVDLSGNPKQEEFFNTALEAVTGQNDYRYMFYGGAIRGGKTFVSLTIFALLCKLYENARYHVIRADFPALQKTTIPSLEKILRSNKDWAWNRDRSNYFVYNRKTDSKIFFMGENISHDPNLDDFLGLESNGFLLEQIEELTEKCLEITISRAGSHYIEPMPKPIILATFNPTQRWIKKRIYEKWLKGELIAPYYFLKALPSDNPYVTDEQWAGWENMADQYKKQYIEGDWTDFDNQNNRWAFAYDAAKHVYECPDTERLNRGQTVYLSFDFNVNPICCNVIQWYNREVKVIEVIKLVNSDTYKMCEYIKVNYPNCLFTVTGDASGAKRDTSQKDNMGNYHIIKQELRLAPGQFKVPSSNPKLEDNKVLVNSILANYPTKIHKTKAAGLIFDLENAKVNPDNSLIKENRKDPTQQLDCFIGSTKIITDNGEKAIWKLKFGDKVLTRNGFCNVVDKWSSLAEVWEYEFEDGTKITCTKDHKFYTKSYGYLSIFRIFNENLKVCKTSFTGASNGISTQSKNISIVPQQYLSEKNFIQDACTGKNGSTILEKYQLPITCTIKTAMRLITKLKTTNWLKSKSILANIQKKGLGIILNLLKNFKLKELRLQLNGINQGPGLNGIEKMQSNVDLDILLTLKKNVNNAGKNSFQKQKAQGSAITIVNRPGVGQISQTLQSTHALIVERNMKHLNTYLKNTVIFHKEISIKKATLIGERKVYDITVENEHEFYANGILVHNCLDGFRYFCNMFMSDFISNPFKYR